ncbi:GNAT family N-acetyltransferase [Mycobacteroides salmoniphilum]|uniref:GNAT family N-acetyltransferase n=1 Tax=Mycobacteroides salmoniphilum TaxID=404941 RepID=UPI001064FB24|nr:GNAT family N-acetyltransferase [Mycobacteroides salmoniphilum]TDZ77126.1 hypothetical protein DE4586_02912 [Mycobacteroides salmoniphilum]TDZ86829.1 hypothetical protein DE4587_02216 [Mycobacteroides salmoniphilum]
MWLLLDYGLSTVTTPADWPSLIAQLTVADRLFGACGYRLVADWLNEQVGLIDDRDFAQSFAEHVDLPGIEVNEYSHRHVRWSEGELLGGIRFYNRDAGRPFVEVIAHSFDDFAQLRECVQAEWSKFEPSFLRLRTQPGQLATTPNAKLHKSIHAGRYRDLRSPNGRVTLERFDDLEEAIALVARRYEWLQSEDPELARVLVAASPEELRGWNDAGQLYGVLTTDGTVGLLAIEPSNIGWVKGDEVSEEVIDAQYCGHGYAAAAQGLWAQQVAFDRDALLIGTIHASNIASRKTAETAGRPRILDDYVVAL